MLAASPPNLGLVAEDEQRRKKSQVPKAVFKDLTGKHPVSALMEICNKRRWPPPSFDLIQDMGPAHKKSFVFKVSLGTMRWEKGFRLGAAFALVQDVGSGGTLQVGRDEPEVEGGADGCSHTHLAT